jgi:hypothetical protein
MPSDPPQPKLRSRKEIEPATSVVPMGSGIVQTDLPTRFHLTQSPGCALLSWRWRDVIPRPWARSAIAAVLAAFVTVVALTLLVGDGLWIAVGWMDVVIGSFFGATYALAKGSVRIERGLLDVQGLPRLVAPRRVEAMDIQAVEARPMMPIPGAPHYVVVVLSRGREINVAFGLDEEHARTLRDTILEMLRQDGHVAPELRVLAGS